MRLFTFKAVVRRVAPLALLVTTAAVAGCSSSKPSPKDVVETPAEADAASTLTEDLVTEPPPLAEQPSGPRRWVSKSGKVLASGDFLSCNSDQVRVRLATGEIGRIALDKLSIEDQVYVRDQMVVDPNEQFEVEKAAVDSADSTADATHAAWIAFFETTLGTSPRRDGEAESKRMGRELITLTRIPLAKVDPDLANVIRGLIDTQESRIAQVRLHEVEIAECDERWRQRFAEVENRVNGVASQANNLNEAAQTSVALSFLGNAVLTQQRNAEVAEMNEKWAQVYAGFDAKSQPLFQKLRSLAPVLEKRHQRKFLLP